MVEQTNALWKKNTSITSSSGGQLEAAWHSGKCVFIQRTSHSKNTSSRGGGDLYHLLWEVVKSKLSHLWYNSLTSDVTFLWYCRWKAVPHKHHWPTCAHRWRFGVKRCGETECVLSVTLKDKSSSQIVNLKNYWFRCITVTVGCYPFRT